MATDRHSELKSLLTGLKLPTMTAQFSRVALLAARENLSHEAFLYELARLESEERRERRVARLLSQSKLPLGKNFEQFDLARLTPLLRQQVEQLQAGRFVAAAVNVVMVGGTGVGKSHLMAALGLGLVRQGYSVLWLTAAALVQRLLLAKRELRLPSELERLSRVDCLLVDDIGYVQHNRDEMEVFFTLLSERYERKSLILTTNLVFSEWERIFRDPLTTLAAIDRVVHHSVILDMLGLESYRAQQAQAQAESLREAHPSAGPPPAGGAIQQGPPPPASRNKEN